MYDASLKQKWDQRATEEYYDQKLKEGRGEAREEGRTEANYRAVANLIRRNFDDAEIASIQEVTQEFIDQVRKDLENKVDRQE